MAALATPLAQAARTGQVASDRCHATASAGQLVIVAGGYIGQAPPSAQTAYDTSYLSVPASGAYHPAAQAITQPNSDSWARLIAYNTPSQPLLANVADLNYQVTVDAQDGYVFMVGAVFSGTFGSPYGAQTADSPLGAQAQITTSASVSSGDLVVYLAYTYPGTQLLTPAGWQSANLGGVGNYTLFYTTASATGPVTVAAPVQNALRQSGMAPWAAAICAFPTAAEQAARYGLVMLV